ncbi:MAG TPA: DUF2169 domain-containing protein, partial [Polyangiaceae bacterium]|nr:DUF2169 domain-containing protein [Polyangiaceae bacterium]
MTWPIATQALGPLSVGTVVWRRRGRARVTAIAKATFAMIHGGFAVPTKPRPIALSEGAPGPSMAAERALEIWPELSETDVLLDGHATAPMREPCAAMAVRLVVWRGEPLLDKTLHVFGDRKRPDAYPRKFSSLALSYERARGGPGTWNPAGIDGRPPNVADPHAEGAPAGFGPIAMTWPDRELELDTQRLLEPGGWDWPE